VGILAGLLFGLRRLLVLSTFICLSTVVIFILLVGPGGPPVAEAHHFMYASRFLPGKRQVHVRYFMAETIVVHALVPRNQKTAIGQQGNQAHHGEHLHQHVPGLFHPVIIVHHEYGDLIQSFSF
jgi:hypothetical protein